VKLARRMAKREYPLPTGAALGVVGSCAYDGIGENALRGVDVVGEAMAVAEFWDGGEVGLAVAVIEMAEVATEVGLDGEYDRGGL
jgi:hypothetical protein